MKNKHKSINDSNLSIDSICLILGILCISSLSSLSQTCPKMSTFCADIPLTCGANNLNNSSCTLVAASNYNGDRCNELCTGSAQNQVHYAFVSNGSKIDIIVTASNCTETWANNPGLDVGVSTECCGGTRVSCARSPTPIPPNYQLKITIPGPVPCKIYYLDIDGYQGTICDYTISVTGGNAPLPLVLKNINNTANNSIDMSLGACGYKFTVEPRDEPCEGYFEWTLDGMPINDFDREVKLDFPNEGDFVLCVQGYIGIPNYNCGQSNISCTTIKVRKDQLYGNTRVLCNENKGFKWHQQKINSSGTYTQGFHDPCHIYDSIVEFIILPKPQSGIVNYISCSRTDPYYDPVYKAYYRVCTANKKIIIPKSTETYACDSSYILNVAYIDLKNSFHLGCRNGNVYMIPDIINYTDTCGIGMSMSLNYSWYEKINNNTVFLGQGKELKILKKGNYQLQILAQYELTTESGTCTIAFDEDIDEDSYLITPSTGSLSGKIQVCKADIECYSISDIVKNPFSFTWSVDQGTIITPNPDTSKKICVQWDKNSTLTHGKICATYSDSCSSNLKACLDIEFGKSQKDVAGPNQKVQGVLGTKMNAQGKKGLWTYAGGPGTVTFTDPTDPKTKVRVSRFGAYEFKWTTIEGDCEIYGFVTVNFFIEFAELEGEYFKHFYNLGEKGSDFINIQSRYENDELNIQGELTYPSAIQFQIINIQGQILYSDEMQTTESTFAKTINLELSSGIYYLVLKNNSEYKINKFIVLE